MLSTTWRASGYHHLLFGFFVALRQLPSFLLAAAACKHKSQDPQTRAVSGPHYLQIWFGYMKHKNPLKYTHRSRYLSLMHYVEVSAQKPNVN
jgi:hypothetical protein